MSEYQIYEFQAVDRPLTNLEREEIRRLSSRVNPTSHQAMFTYSYGGFRGNPLDTLVTYFDAMYYVANFGVQELAFRLPKSLLDREATKAYLYEGCIELTPKDQWYILDISYSMETGFGWLEEESRLPDFIDLRQEILQGDYRGLYLAWLRLVTLKFNDIDCDVEFDEEALEPPVPPGLQTLSPAQAAFVQTFEIDPAILAAAQQASGPLSNTPEIDWSGAIAQLSSQEQQTFLRRLAEGEPNLTAKFQKALRPFVTTSSSATSTQPPRRSAKQLLALAEVEQKKAMQLAKESAKAERIKALQTLVPKEPYLWEEVEKIMREKKSPSYGRATELLVDLKDLAVFQHQEVIFEARLHKLCESYSPTPALVKRLKQAKLR
jgi:hypothetical protein